MAYHFDGLPLVVIRLQIERHLRPIATRRYPGQSSDKETWLRNTSKALSHWGSGLLHLGWQAFNMACKPFLLTRLFLPWNKSDPAQDPNGDGDFVDRKEKGSLFESDASFSNENPIVT
ncbi:hypothetical protein D5086_020683 [Populus alba]|uniref:Uncharacterized protein n=1 Tax=Populus alba TaxID=43335 RepID=A0ACC4BKT6_POPAL